MKKSIITRFLLFSCLLCFYTPYCQGQTIDYNRIILPDNAKSVSLEEILIQLAWRNHPDNSILKFQEEIAEQEVKLASLEWIGMLGVTGNLNEYNIQELTGNELTYNNNFYPRYNFHIQIPFSNFYEIPLNKKIRKLELRVESERIKAEKIRVRNLVLNAYSDYKRAKDIFKIQFDFEELANSNFIVAEEEFKNGELPIEDYYVIYKNYQQQRIEKIEAENAYSKSKYNLESLIGVPIEEVNRQ